MKKCLTSGPASGIINNVLNTEKSPSPVYGARLELVYGLIPHRGFESLLLRQMKEYPLIQKQPSKSEGCFCIFCFPGTWRYSRLLSFEGKSAGAARSPMISCPRSILGKHGLLFCSFAVFISGSPYFHRFDDRPHGFS